MSWLKPSVALLAGVLLVAACSGGDPSAQDPGAGRSPVATLESLESSAPEATAAPTPRVDDPGEPIVVATLLDEENILAPLDRQAGVGFIAAIERLDREGGLLGRTIDVVREPTQSRLSVTDKAAGKIIAAGADLLVVTCELDFARPVIERAEQAGILVISPCGAEHDWGTGEASPIAFSMVASNEVYGAQLADLLWFEGTRSVGVLWESAAPEARAECGGFADRWADLGGEVTVEVPVGTLKAAELLAEQPDTLEELSAAEVMFVCAFQRLGTRALSTLRDEGVLTPVFGGLTMDNATFRAMDVEGIGEYRMATFASVGGDDPSPAVAASAIAYESIDGIPPATGRFVLGVDLALVWAEVVRSAGTVDGPTLAAALRAADRFDVASGVIGFGGTQAVVDRELRIMRYESGRMVFDRVWPDPDATVAPGQ